MNSAQKPRFKGNGLITFEDVPIALKAEKVLKAAGIENKLVAPPPKFRMGCALGVEIMIAKKDEIIALFKQKDVPVSKIVELE
jgi:hypothetical protein